MRSTAFWFVFLVFFLDKQWIVILSCDIPLLRVWFHVVLCPSTGNAIQLWLQATKASNVVTIVFSPTSTHNALSLHLILSGFILVSQASVLLQNRREVTFLFVSLFRYFLFYKTPHSRGGRGGFPSFDWYCVCNDGGQKYAFFLGKKSWFDAAEDGGGRWNTGLSFSVII